MLDQREQTPQTRHACLNLPPYVLSSIYLPVRPSIDVKRTYMHIV